MATPLRFPYTDLDSDAYLILLCATSAAWTAICEGLTQLLRVPLTNNSPAQPGRRSSCFMRAQQSGRSTLASRLRTVWKLLMDYLPDVLGRLMSRYADSPAFLTGAS